MSSLLRRLLPLGMLFFAIFAHSALFGQESADSSSVAVSPATALENYLHNGDLTYHWEVIETTQIGGVATYHLLLTSQTWRDIVWTHQLSIFVPTEISRPGALLMITGGSNSNGAPDWVEETGEHYLLSQIAKKSHAVTALVRQVPNQPLFDSLQEDPLVAYTLYNYIKDGDMTWPLLFPMTKSAVRAMDAVTEFCAEELHTKIDGFFVTGGSKRGWTTWLAAAQGDRVRAAAPMVIDMLNIPASMLYQTQVFGSYSDQINDYDEAGVLQLLESEAGKQIVQMIDPYSYRHRLTMPKLLIMATNDHYWVTDNVKNYIDSIPGINRLRYIPNAGHNMNGGEEAMETVGAFFASLFSDQMFPTCSWKGVTRNHRLKINIDMSREDLIGAELWKATSSSRDFRQSAWESTPVELPQEGNLLLDIPLSGKGYEAYYVNLIYQTEEGTPYRISTRIFMTGDGKLL